MDSTLNSPFVIEEEEELIDANFLPPSFFTNTTNNYHLNTTFVEPPSQDTSPSDSTSHIPSPSADDTDTTLHNPPRIKSLPCIPPRFPDQDPDSPVSVEIALTSLLIRSPSTETTSTQEESVITEDDLSTSPIPTTRILDRQRSTKSTFDTMKDTSAVRGGFRRIPGAVSPDAVSSLNADPSMVYSPGTLRRINALSSSQFQRAVRSMGGARRVASAKGNLDFMRKGKAIHRSENDEKTSQKSDSNCDENISIPQDGGERS